MKKTPIANHQETTVIERILGDFISDLQEKEELKLVSERLKVTLLDNIDFSEAALKEALFGKMS